MSKCAWNVQKRILSELFLRLQLFELLGFVPVGVVRYRSVLRWLFYCFLRKTAFIGEFDRHISTIYHLIRIFSISCSNDISLIIVSIRIIHKVSQIPYRCLIHIRRMRLSRTLKQVRSIAAWGGNYCIVIKIKVCITQCFNGTCFNLWGKNGHDFINQQDGQSVCFNRNCFTFAFVFVVTRGCCV